MSEATPEATMACPKCSGEMHTVERNGVTIEQCRKCHGIFLDRGEFEQLLARETSYLGNGESPSGQASDDAGRPSGWRSWRR